MTPKQEKKLFAIVGWLLGHVWETASPEDTEHIDEMNDWLKLMMDGETE